MHCSGYGCNLEEQILNHAPEQQSLPEQSGLKLRVCGEQMKPEQMVLVMRWTYLGLHLYESHPQHETIKPGKNEQTVGHLARWHLS